MESSQGAEEPEIEIEMSTDDLDADSPDVVDDLDDPWFATESGPVGDVYEIDPVHPLRRLSAWVRDRLAA